MTFKIGVGFFVFKGRGRFGIAAHFKIYMAHGADGDNTVGQGVFGVGIPVTPYLIVVSLSPGSR